MPTWRLRALILLFNGAISFLVLLAAPLQPRLSDRAEYEYTGRHGLAPSCPVTIYCYRILVPVALEQIPLDPEMRWRALQWLAHTATGTVTAIVVSPFASPFIASTLLQTSYAFSFTAYDPFTPDPVVFLIAALILSCWMHDRAIAAALIVLVGVFAKETVALIAAAPAIAVLLSDRRTRVRWAGGAVLAWIVLLFFHWYMDTFNGWSISKNPAANFSGGSWLVLWWRNNPSLTRKALMLFAPFGWAWVFAIAGYRSATQALRQLAIGALLPIAALIYVQTPERALGNAFFVIVPLAAIFLSRISPAAGWAAAITNGLLTAKIGLSTAWLPATSILLIPASLTAVWAFAASRRQSA